MKKLYQLPNRNPEKKLFIMVNYFIFDYSESKDGKLCRSGEYYSIRIEGDLEESELYLQSISKDVRYIVSKPPTKKDTGKRTLSPNLTCVACKHAFSLKSVWSKPTFNRVSLPVDSRHTILKECANE